MPAPRWLIEDDLSKITQSILCFFKKHPRARPPIPAPIIAICFL